MVRGRGVVPGIPMAHRRTASARASPSRHRRPRLLALRSRDDRPLWATFLERRTGAAAAAALFYAAFAPGQIYYYAVFPLSMLTLSTLAGLWLLYRERYVFAGATGASPPSPIRSESCLRRSRPYGFLRSGAFRLASDFAGVAITSGLIIAGLLSLMIVQRIDTGHWDAFFLIQEKYRYLHGSQDPILATLDIVRGGVQNLGDGITVVVALQTAFVTLVLALVLVHAFLRRRSLDRVDLGCCDVGIAADSGLLRATRAGGTPAACGTGRSPADAPSVVTRGGRRRDRRLARELLPGRHADLRAIVRRARVREVPADRGADERDGLSSLPTGVTRVGLTA